MKVYCSVQFINFIQVNDNGVISFNSRYNVRTPLSLPLSGTQQIIAPYWADVDTRGTGQILHRQTTNATLLSRATREIRAAFSDSENVTIQSLLIATWNNVGYYFNNADKVCMYIHSCIATVMYGYHKQVKFHVGKNFCIFHTLCYHSVQKFCAGNFNGAKL